MKLRNPLLVIFLVVFFDLVSFGIVIPILPYYSKSFGANAFVWSWVMAIYSIAQFLFAPLWGNLSDTYGRRPILLISILLSAISACVMVFINSILGIFLCRLSAGIFAANISTATAYISDTTNEENRAKGMGIIGAGFGLGFIFGPIIGGILSPYGLHVPILFSAALGFTNFILAYFILAEPLQDLASRRKNRRRFSFALVQKALSNSSTRMPILLFFLSTFSFAQLEVCFGFFVLAKYKYEAYQAGLLLALMGIIMVLIQGGGIGRLTKKYGESNLARMGFLFMCLSLALAAWTNALPIFIFALCGIAIGNALINPSLSSLMSKAAPREHTGAMMGIYQSSSSLARIFAPPIAGFSYDRIGIHSPLWMAALILGIAFSAATSLLQGKNKSS